ncbi:MAG: hypothetical protein ACXV5L_09815 [Thermoanaerobaculia bacterium]
MSDAPGEKSADFEFFSNEYSQALQAYEAIKKQAATLMLLGASGDLRQFGEQFIEMAERVRQLAVERNEANFAEWFGELAENARALLAAVPERK